MANRLMPYIGLSKFRGKPHLEISIKDDNKPNRFALTDAEAGLKRAAAFLAETGTQQWLCSSSVDFPGDYGLSEDLDIRGTLSHLVAAIIGPKPIAYWVFACTNCSELLNWGRDGDTTNPFITKEEAVDQARFLADSKEHENDTIYILYVFEGGRIRFEEYHR